jgi:hypothetical protein
MAFVIENNQVVSFAEFQDVVDKDQRIFSANEGLSDDTVDAALVRATERILTRMRNTGWWRGYYVSRDNSINYQSVADIPAIDANKISGREQDFTDLCVYVGLSEYILPGIADFADADSSERQKMAYYTQKSSELFDELVTAGDWYDFDGDGIVESTERQPGQINLKRVR